MEDFHPSLQHLKRELQLFTGNGQRAITGDDIRHFYAVVRQGCANDLPLAVAVARIFTELSRAARDDFTRLFYRRAVTEVAAATGYALAPEIPGLLRTRLIAYVTAPGAPRLWSNAMCEGDPVVVTKALESAVSDSDCTPQERLFTVRLAECGVFFEPLLCTAFTDTQLPRRNAACKALAHAVALANRPKLELLSVREATRCDISNRYELLVQVSNVLLALKSSKRDFTVERCNILLKAIDVEPCAAAGILRWTKAATHVERVSDLIFVLPKILALVDAVGEKQAGLCKEAVDVLHRAFIRKWNADEPRVGNHSVGRIQELLVDALVAATSWGAAANVARLTLVYYVQDDTLDDSYMRNIVLGILKLVCGPYGEEFKAIMRTLLLHPRMVRVFNNHPGARQRAEFLKNSAKPQV